MAIFKNMFWLCLFSVVFMFSAGLFAQEQIPVVETETGFYYTVQKGDTLWDLSRRFSDSPWQWPDLWSQNDQISNPHLIYPGQQIRLFRRRDFQKFAKPVEEPKEGLGPEMEEQPPPFFLYTPIQSIGFIREKPVESMGAIFELADSKEMISVDDTVYIRYSTGVPLRVKERYVSYLPVSPPVVNEKTGEVVGTLHLLTGVVEVVRAEPQFCEARVVGAYRTIRKGNQIMPYEQRDARITLTESVDGLYGYIVSSEKLTRLFGDDTIVFIDKGEVDGVRPGQIYKAFLQKEVEFDSLTKDTLQLTPIDLGTLVVLMTEKTTATVLISQANRPIPLWSRFGSPLP